MIKALKKLLIALVITTMVITPNIIASASDAPDLSATGDITFTFKKKDKPIAGGNVLLYRVGDAYYSEGQMKFKWCGKFENCKIDINDLKSKENANKMADYIKSNKISGVEKTVDSKGTASFGQQASGLYFVMQTKEPRGYDPLTPFFVSMPLYVDGEYVYEISASPKLNIKGEFDVTGGDGDDQHGDNTTVTGTTSTTSKDDKTSTTNEDGKYDEFFDKDKNTTSKNPSDPELPKTGRNNSYVPILAVSGLALLFIGFAIRNSGRRAENE